MSCVQAVFECAMELTSHGYGLKGEEPEREGREARRVDTRKRDSKPD